MRLTLRIIGAVGAVTALSACGGGERAALITKAESDCVASIPAGTPGVNAQRMCSCVVAALSEGKSEQELRELYKSSAPPAGAQAAVQQCMMQEVQTGGK